MSEEMALSIGEMAGGLALVVLGILAIGHIDTMFLNAIAVIVAGVVLVVESARISAELGSALASVTGQAELADMGGMNAGMMAGAIGVVLGILALIGVATGPLVAVSVIVFGAAVLFDHAVRTRMRTFRLFSSATSMPGEPTATAQIALSAATTAGSASILVGVGLIALGILALAGLSVDILMSVALLALGAHLLIENTSVAGHITSMMSL